MIILDGSRSFFDTESIFSDLVARARTSETEESVARQKLYSAFAAFSHAKEEYVAASGDITKLAVSFLGDAGRIVVASSDGFGRDVMEAIPEREYHVCGKNDELKLKASDIVSAVNECGAEAVVLSNPCFPTSLAMEREDILGICEKTCALVIVDESRLVSSEDSLFIDTCKYDNLAVVRRFNFGGSICMAAGRDAWKCKELPSVSDMMAASVIFEHSSAVRTYERKLSDSIGSLYIRCKKLAIKYESIERIYRSRADFVYMSVSNADKKADLFLDEGIKVGHDDGHIWIFAGDTKENDEFISKSGSVF